MNPDFLKYLKSYSYDPEKVNRIIVSNFLYSNNIENCRNSLINNLLINKQDSDFEELSIIINRYPLFSLEDLVESFEFVISPEEKVVTGAIYTPNNIREFIVDHIISSTSSLDDNFKICDLACGCSGFLLTATQKIKSVTLSSYSEIFSNNIYGLDIQGYSITRSAILLSLAAIIDGEDETEFNFNLYEGNALDFNWLDQIENFSGFDAVVGNPPYVCSRNIEEKTRELLLNWSVCKSGHPDLYIPFFEIGVTNLKPGGELGLITMNTFFKSVNGRALRKYFQREKRSFKIIDFGGLQVFQSKSTYTCVCLIEKKPSSHLNYIKLNDLDSLSNNEITYKKIEYDELDSEKGWNLQEKQILNQIESIGTPLGKKFITRNGIATLKNDVYIFDPVDEDKNFYYLRNGSLYPIERKICVDIINPNKLTKLDSIDPIRKKVIFPYSYEDEQPKLIPEGQMVENFPNAYNYLKDKRESLASRDKGKGQYAAWYAYGRNQSLERYKFKLFFPHITPSIPNYVVNDDPNLLFVNGLAIIGNTVRELLYLKKIMSSRLFWFYIINSSKPYGSGYYSLSRNYIKNFGIYDFTEEQINHLINLSSQDEVDCFLESLYGIDLSRIEQLGLNQADRYTISM